MHTLLSLFVSAISWIATAVATLVSSAFGPAPAAVPAAPAGPTAVRMVEAGTGGGVPLFFRHGDREVTMHFAGEQTGVPVAVQRAVHGRLAPGIAIECESLREIGPELPVNITLGGVHRRIIINTGTLGAGGTGVILQRAGFMDEGGQG